MTQLYSSPSKTASQAASGGIAAAQPEIAQIESNYSDEQNAARGAIAALPPNSYLQTGENMPAPTKLNAPAPVAPPPTPPPPPAPINTFRPPAPTNGGGMRAPTGGSA